MPKGTADKFVPLNILTRSRNCQCGRRVDPIYSSRRICKNRMGQSGLTWGIRRDPRTPWLATPLCATLFFCRGDVETVLCVCFFFGVVFISMMQLRSVGCFVRTFKRILYS